MKKWNLLAMVLVLSALVSLVNSSAAYSGAKMMLPPLRVPPPGYLGGGTLVAYAINDSGQIVGNGELCELDIRKAADVGFLYSGGTMTELGTPYPELMDDWGFLLWYWSRATGINNNGKIIVNSGNKETHLQKAFLYSGGTWTELDTLNEATGINDSGQVVGNLYGGTNEADRCAVLYSEGNVKGLGNLGGGYSKANGINNSGQIVGRAELASGELHAFLYDNSKMKSLGHLTPTLGYGFSEAYAINNYGQIVGSSITASGQEHAFLYSGGKMKDIDTLPGGTDSCAVSINDNGQIVGWSTTASGEIHAFLYSRGKMEDLGTLPGGIWSYATGINNKGQIVGYSDALGVGPGFDGMPEGSHCIYSFLYNSRSSLPGILPLLLGSN